MRVEMVTRKSYYKSEDRLTRQRVAALRPSNAFGTTRLVVRTDDGKSRILGEYTHGSTTTTKWIEFIYEEDGDKNG